MLVPQQRTNRENLSGTIISALLDAVIHVGLAPDDDSRHMITLLDRWYPSNRTVSIIAVQTQLFRMQYTGQNISTYNDQYNTLSAQLERMRSSSAIQEAHKSECCWCPLILIAHWSLLQLL